MYKNYNKKNFKLKYLNVFRKKIMKKPYFFRVESPLNCLLFCCPGQKDFLYAHVWACRKVRMDMHVHTWMLQKCIWKSVYKSYYKWIMSLYDYTWICRNKTIQVFISENLILPDKEINFLNLKNRHSKHIRLIFKLNISIHFLLRIWVYAKKRAIIHLEWLKIDIF